LHVRLIEITKSMGHFAEGEPENKVIAHNNPTK